MSMNSCQDHPQMDSEEDSQVCDFKDATNTANHVSKLDPSTLAKILKYTTNNQRKILAHRRVCRQWNACICAGFDLHFHLFLSDTEIYGYLTLFQPTLPKLKIYSIETHDLTTISFENLLSLFSTISFENVKRFEFGEGTSRDMMQILLQNYPRVQSLTFEEIWCPVYECKVEFPTISIIQNLCKVTFNNLKEFTLTQPLLNHNQNSGGAPGNGNNNGNNGNAGFINGDGEDLQDFFQVAYYPQLQKLDLTIVIMENDVETYLYVHYFIAKHHETLRDLSLSFFSASETALTTTSWLNPQENGIENEANNCHAYAKDIQEHKSNFTKNLEKNEHYTTFCHRIAKMRLVRLTVSFIRQEGPHNLPWNQSLKFLKHSDDCLEEMEVNGSLQFDNQGDILSAIKANASRLKTLCIRNIPAFDCSMIQKCENLEAFSFGRLFTPITEPRRESLDNIHGFPEPDTLKKLKCVLIGVPLSKENLFVLAGKLRQAQILWVRGDGGDLYTVVDIQQLIGKISNLRELEMRIQMEQASKEAMAEYFLNNSEWSIRYLINEFDNISEVEFNVHKRPSRDWQ